METLNQKRDSWIAWIFFVSLLIVASAMLTGCGEDKKKGTPASSPYNNGRIVHPNCADCGIYTDQLLTAANGSMDNNANFAIALYSPDQANNTAYSGAVDVAGYLEVFSTPIVECPFVPGHYQLRVVSPNGTYAGNQSSTWNLTGLEMEGIHDDGRVIRLYVPYMEFYDAQTEIGVDGYEYHNTLRGEVHVISADGYACGWSGVPRKIFFVL